MEIQIKKTIKAGNSSAVLLPRAWLNKEVRVELIEKTHEKILLETLSILTTHLSLEKIIGVYLVGSYARKEQTPNSDIDILVITNNIDKPLISQDNYNILLVSTKLLQKKLNTDILPIGQMLKEATPLLNSPYLDSIKIKVTKKNISWYLKTTQEKIKLIKKATQLQEKNSGKTNSLITYTLILRIRTLYIIETLIKNTKYSNKDFLSLIVKLSGNSIPYEDYLSVKNNQNTKPKSTIEQVRTLNKYLESYLSKINKLI